MRTLHRLRFYTCKIRVEQLSLVIGRPRRRRPQSSESRRRHRLADAIDAQPFRIRRVKPQRRPHVHRATSVESPLDSSAPPVSAPKAVLGSCYSAGMISAVRCRCFSLIRWPRCVVGSGVADHKISYSILANSRMRAKAPPLQTEAADYCLTCMRPAQSASGYERNPGQMEVRRVTTVSTQKASKPERCSRPGFALKEFYTCKNVSLVGPVGHQVGSSSRPRRSLAREVRHIVPPPDPCGKQRERRAGSRWRCGSDYGNTDDRCARTINPVHTMSSGGKIFASS